MALHQAKDRIAVFVKQRRAIVVEERVEDILTAGQFLDHVLVQIDYLIRKRRGKKRIKKKTRLCVSAWCSVLKNEVCHPRQPA